jgi:hypothetical protein
MDTTPGEFEHDFTLVLTGIADLTPEVENALLGAGCDDGTIAMRLGRPYITFSRLAPSMKDAILSAIENVRNAGIGADVLRVDYCNLVTQADIARKINRSRQLVYQYMVGERGPGGFPPPACRIGTGVRSLTGYAKTTWSRQMSCVMRKKSNSSITSWS